MDTNKTFIEELEQKENYMKNYMKHEPNKIYANKVDYITAIIKDLKEEFISYRNNFKRKYL